MSDHSYFANLIWQIADLLRGPYRPPQYERVMLPMTVLRRFDCVLAETKSKVLTQYERMKGGRVTGEALDVKLNGVAGQRFHNHSELDFYRLRGDPSNIASHLVHYIKGFSSNVREIFEYFEFEKEIEKMEQEDILYSVVKRFSDVDLHPNQVPNDEMGLIFENLVRRFNELANETAGDYFTPRDIVELMVHILFNNDDELLSKSNTVRTLFDPACGTGGMLAGAQRYLRTYHEQAKLLVYGQDYNNRAYAIAASDMLIKQVDHNGVDNNIKFGNIFTQDQFKGWNFDYFLTNPPFGVKWKREQQVIRRESDEMGFDGRFGAGLPRISDGSLLFLQHMWAKRREVLTKKNEYGSRLAIVFSGSPLFSGGAGSGESNIRKWIIENDWLEAIIALPEQMFYNTSIGTYIWIMTNNKEGRRKKKVQLIDARDMSTPGGSPGNNRSMGNKRRHISEKQMNHIVKCYGQFKKDRYSRIFDNDHFGYTRVTIERPLRLRFQITPENKMHFLDICPELIDDMQAIDKDIGRVPLNDWNIVEGRIVKILKRRGTHWTLKQQEAFRYAFTERDEESKPVFSKDVRTEYEADKELRDFINVPMKDNIDEYFRREVLPHVADAWMDRSMDKIGYEINFNRYFHTYNSPRPLEQIESDLHKTEKEFVSLMEKEVRYDGVD